MGFPSLAEKNRILAWLDQQHYNLFGEPAEKTLFAGGNPLFDERTGRSVTLYEYLLRKFPARPWQKMTDVLPRPAMVQ